MKGLLSIVVCTAALSAGSAGAAPAQAYFGLQQGLKAGAGTEHRDHAQTDTQENERRRRQELPPWQRYFLDSFDHPAIRDALLPFGPGGDRVAMCRLGKCPAFVVPPSGGLEATA